MAWLADLAPCTYVHDDVARLKAVGWLEPEHPFEKGPVDDAFLAKLDQLRRSPWEPDHFMGYHACGFCNPSKREGAVRANGPSDWRPKWLRERDRRR